MKPVTQLLISPLHNHVKDILTEANIKESIRNPNRFNLDIGAVQSAMKRPECGLFEKTEHVWPLRDHPLATAMKTPWKRIFLMRFRCDWLWTNHRNEISLTNYRSNPLKPMISMGVAVNIHVTDIDIW